MRRPRASEPPALPVQSPNDQEWMGDWRPTPLPEIESWLEQSAGSLQILSADRSRRIELLTALVSQLHSRRDTLCDLVIDEVGKRPDEALAELEYAESFLTDAIGRLETHAFEERPMPERRIQELPAGVALLMAPYNDPVAGLMRKIGPAIAAGCPVLVKPSPFAVLTAREALGSVFASIAPELALLVLADAPATVQGILAHPAVRVVSFTGSTAVGRIIATEAGRHLVRPILELGGNNPFIVLPSANLDQAVEDLVARKIRAAGQACSSVNRVYVHREVFPGFLERLRARVGTVMAGSARDPDVQMGPVRHAEAHARLRRLVREAEASGEPAFAAAEGREMRSGEPLAFPLTVLEGGPEQPSVLDAEEAFGPLVSLRPFASAPALFEAVARERHTLAAYVYGDPQEASACGLERLRFGSVGLNSTAVQDARVPTGGFGEAGYGREGGDPGLREYLATRNLRSAGVP